MGMLIRLRSPQGDVGVFNVDEYDVPKMLGDGWKRAGTVMVAAHERTAPVRRRDLERFTPAELESMGMTAQPPGVPKDRPAGRREPAIVKALPFIVGTVGGTIGGAGGTVAGFGVGGVPGALGGAAVGGAGGEAVRQLIDRAIGVQAPETAGEAAAGIGLAGAEQAAYEGGGRVIGAGVKAVGRPIMQAAIKATPEGARAAISAGLTRTRAGAAKLMELLGEHGQRVRMMVRQAMGRGHQIDPVDLLVGGERRLEQEVQILGGGIGSRMPEAAADLDTYRTLSTGFMRNNIPNGPLTPVQVEELATKFDKIAEPIWNRFARGDKDIPGVDLARARWYRHMADEMRAWLEQVTPPMIDPATGRLVTLAEQNAYAKSLIELKPLIMPGKSSSIAARVAARTAGPAVGAGIGASMPGNRSMNALYGAGVGAALTSPEALSWLALRTSDPVLARILGQVPRAVGYAATPDRTTVGATP